MKLEITKEKVLAAASKCSTAKETLKVLFPEAFNEGDKYFDLSQLKVSTKGGGPYEIFTPESAKAAGFDNAYFFQIRNNGFTRLGGRGFFLDKEYNWVIEDEDGDLVLVPTKKS